MSQRQRWPAVVQPHEWAATALGLFSQSMRVVPLYATLGASAIEFIIQHAQLHIILVSSDKLEGPLPPPHTILCLLLPLSIIQFDPDSRWSNDSEEVREADVQVMEGYGIQLMGYTSLRAIGRQQLLSLSLPLHPPVTSWPSSCTPAAPLANRKGSHHGHRTPTWQAITAPIHSTG